MIRIRGIDYWVKGFHAPNLEDLDADEGFDLGGIEHFKAEIDICVDVDAQVQDQTILHEALHAITKGNPDWDEEKVEFISSEIYAFLRDNGLISVGWMEKLIDETESGEELNDRSSSGHTEPDRVLDRTA